MNRLAPLLIAIAVVSPRLADGGPGELSARVVLSTMPGISDTAPVLTRAQAWANLAWVVAITAVAGLVAVAPVPGDRRRRRLVGIPALARHLELRPSP